MMTILRHCYTLSFCLVETYLIFSALLGIFFVRLVVATMPPNSTDDVPCNLTRLDYYFYLCMFQVRNTKISDCKNETRPRPLCVLWLSHRREEPMYSVVGETIMLILCDHDHYACCNAVAIAAVWSGTNYAIL